MFLQRQFLQRQFLQRLLLCLVACSVATACSAPEPAPPPEDPTAELNARFEANIEPLIKIRGEDRPPKPLTEHMAEIGVPALSVAVLDKGEIAWARAYGMADVAAQRPATPETLFQAASISKPVAALAALDMVEDGLLGLDENINDKLASWQLPDNEHTANEKVTLRRLLNHTAGTTVWGFPGYALTDEIPDSAGVLDGEGNTDEVRVYKEPGVDWQYSGGGYTIMQLLLADVSGESFPEVLRQRVLEPLGMTTSTFEQPLPEARRGQEALAYRRNGDLVADGWHAYPEMAAAGLWTTPSDLLSYAMGVLRSRAGAEGAILNQELTAEMLTPGDRNHGLGPQMGDEGVSFGHGGSNEGFRCRLTVFFDGETGAAVMTNSDNGGRLYQEVFTTLAREYGWPGFEAEVRDAIEVDAEKYAELVGTYHVEDMDLTIEIVHTDDGRLTIGQPGNPPEEFLPQAEAVWFSRVDGQEVTFIVEEGEISGFSSFGGELVAKRVLE